MMTSSAKNVPAIGALNEADTAAATPQPIRLTVSERLSPKTRARREQSAAPRCTTGPSRPTEPPTPMEPALTSAAPSPVRSPMRPLRVAEVRVRQAPLLPASPTAASDAPGDGFHVYELTAFSELGFESPPSDPTTELAVGDVVPPAAPQLTARVVNGWDVELPWNAVADAVRYDLFRDGAKIAEHTDPEGLLAIDPRRPNGTYRYTVRAIDAAGNSSPPSNEAAATVAVAPPLPPLLLSVASPAEGGAHPLLERHLLVGGPLGVDLVVRRQALQHFRAGGARVPGGERDARLPGSLGDGLVAGHQTRHDGCRLLVKAAGKTVIH